MRKHFLFLLSVLAIPQVNAASISYFPCAEQECVQRFKDIKVSARKHINANNKLGDMYLNGYGTDESKSKALKAFKKAGSWGSVEGNYKAGLLIISDDSLADKEKGLYFLRDSAKSGHKNAVYFMAEILSNSSYGIQNLEQADFWLAKAAEQRHEQVPKIIARLKSEQKFNEQNFPQTVVVLEVLTAESPDEQTPLGHPAGALAPNGDEIEVVTVQTPKLGDLIDTGIEYYQSAPISITKNTTGTRIKGRSCQDKANACSDIPTDQFIRYYWQFLMSDF